MNELDVLGEKEEEILSHIPEDIKKHWSLCFILRTKVLVLNLERVI